MRVKNKYKNGVDDSNISRNTILCVGLSFRLYSSSVYLQYQVRFTFLHLEMHVRFYFLPLSTMTFFYLFLIC